MEITALKDAVPGFGAKSHAEKIKIFGWWLHTHAKHETFSGSDVLKCYDKLHFARPASIGPYLSPLVDKKELLKSSAGYRLEGGVRDALDTLYGQSKTAAAIARKKAAE